MRNDSETVSVVWQDASFVKDAGTIAATMTVDYDHVGPNGAFATSSVRHRQCSTAACTRSSAATERREVGGEPLRQHQEHDDTAVDRGRVPLRVSVNRAAGNDQHVRVGDADEHLALVVRQQLDDLHMIKVPRFRIVDGRPQKRAQIAHAGRRGE
jgi:hypothetical protein